jgi:RHS repeat-associated protein
VRFSRSTLTLSAALAAVALLFASAPLSAQAPLISIRPTKFSNEDMGNPQNANDDNENTSAGRALGKVCHFDWCTLPTSTSRATWFAFPEGRPHELRVKWNASAAGLIWSPGDMMEVRAKIEYSLGGGWIELDSFLKVNPVGCTSDPSCNYPTHEKSVALDPSVDTTQVKVRGTLTVSLLNCAKCTPIESTNLAGGISIYDIRILADPGPKKSSCPDGTCCKNAGPGGASPGGGGPSTAPPGSGPGATFRYAAGGAGVSGMPDVAAWNQILGRNWSHDYAERIVVDPDDSIVWLITRFATVRRFTGLSGGVYQTVSPTDEFRKLHRTVDGWELHGLDGTISYFGNDGLWLRTVDANGNAKVATYSAGRLASVAFPDGRSETFAYGTGGKLASITEVGVGGTASRTWTYAWTGLDLTRIGRPDGTAWVFTYSSGFPGNLSRMELEGTNGTRRVESAWSLDGKGNVSQMWRGDTFYFSSGSVDKHNFAFDNQGLPSVTTVTDPLGKVSTYTLGRDDGSDKPKLLGISGDCPTCGVGPNSQLFYEDPAHPLLPTREIDGAGTTTLYAYDANGRMTSKTEAAGTSLERTTTWQYAGPFPMLPTRIEVPSTSGSGFRATALSYDAAGNQTGSTVSGVESGSAFSLSATTAYNAAGRPTSIDPPGYSTQDQTTYTYDSARGNLIALSRTDPIVGTTTFEYDAFNRLVRTTDPNGVVTETTYDSLNRVTSVIRRGATPADDLVTTNTYNVFGDLFRTTLPAGNVVEYTYDTAGRLRSIERKPNATTPGERTFYTLDGAGNRTREELQRWSGSAWVTESSTDFTYSTRCVLDKMVYPDGTATEYGYDCKGRLQKVWDAKHPSNSQTNPAMQLYSYDALNHLASVTQPWTGAGGGAATTSYGYDVQDHLSQVTDANGTVTSFTFSDRDLLTREASEVSGITDYSYNDHGEKIGETDARGVTLTRTLDALDRVTFVDTPDNNLDTTYVYDDPGVSFSKGRLTAISRSGQSLAYGYDRFGRLLQDGIVGYGYDRNGSRTTLTYPGGVVATTSYDFADRPSALSVRDGANPSQTLVTAAAYKPFGPLSSLTLGNGLVESRGFNARYFPSSIAVAGHLGWNFTTDSVGNITGITDTLSSASSRTFGYQDVDYFLTQGDGPWGTRSWAYDRIGNRLSKTRDGVTDAYVYAPNAAGGNSPRLIEIDHGGGGATLVSYDAAGDVTQRDTGTASLRSTYDAERHLAELRSVAAGVDQGVDQLLYDPRGFLSHATFTIGTPARDAAATYSSEGVLLHRSHLVHGTPSTSEIQRDGYVLYFGSRPLALFEKRQETPPGGSALTTTSLAYLTTDHLGTPVLATDTTGTTVWQGGLEPFGEDWNSAQAAGLFLRFPGQWEDETWQNANLDSGLYQNVHRWFESSTGRYSKPDPLGLGLDRNESPYLYGKDNPLRFTDPLGLFKVADNCKQQCGDVGQKDAIDKGINNFRTALSTPRCKSLLQSQTGMRGRDLYSLQQQCDSSGTIICDCNDTNNYGKTTPSLIGPIVIICGGSFRGPQAPSSPYKTAPSGLGNTIFHECLHWGRFGGTEPGANTPNGRLFQQILDACVPWSPPR